MNRVSQHDFLYQLQILADHYIGGGIAGRLHEWKGLTQDPEILDIVQHGLSLKLGQQPTPTPPIQLKFSQQETLIITEEIQTLLNKNVIVESTIEKNDYFSPIFIRKNKDETNRVILNLKKLNANVDTYHFKMESIKNVLNMVTPNSFMASVDLKKAFYSIPIQPSHQHLLKFYWNRAYKFLVMPNGYSDAMRVFTKILKPPFAQLRSEGYLSSLCG